MAAHIGQPTRSRRFIKVYLMTWALLAIGALLYLTMLAFPPQAASPTALADLEPAKSEPAKSEPASSEPEKSAAEVPKALAEVRSLEGKMEGNLSEVRKDVAELQDAMGERVANEKAVDSRLTAIEERVATIEAPRPPPATPARPGAKRPEKTAQKVVAPHTTADISATDENLEPRKVKVQRLPAPPAASKAAAPPATPIETGSITPKADVIFGKAVVKPAARKGFAVQLAAGKSRQLLRRSWGQLVERHASSLAALEPRVMPPRAEDGRYRLLAGPVPTKADAERICAEMGVGPKACFATNYGGAPL